MSDNSQIYNGPGDNIRSVDKGGVKTPPVLIDIGGTGAEVLVDGSNPLPASLPNVEAVNTVGTPSKILAVGGLDVDTGAVRALAVDGGFNELKTVSRIVGTNGQPINGSGAGGVVVEPNQAMSGVPGDTAADRVLNVGGADASYKQQYLGVSVAGTPATANVLQVGGKDGDGNAQALSINSAGALNVSLNDARVFIGEAYPDWMLGIAARTPDTTASPLNLDDAGSLKVSTGRLKSVTVTPTVTVADSYGVNYVVGGLLTFSGAIENSYRAILKSVSVTCKQIETSGFTLYLFNGNNTFASTWTDAAVAAINSADVPLIAARIQLTNVGSELGTSTFLGAQPELAINNTVFGADLYGVLLSNAALTNQFSATDDVAITITLEPKSV